MSSDDDISGKALSVSRRVMRGFTPERLVDARRDLGISQAELARRAGVGADTVRRWEAGESSPQVDLLGRVTAKLGVTIEDIVQVPIAERFPGDWRVLRGLTQPQLGAAAQIPTQIVGSVERGEISLSENMEAKLSEALSITREELRASYERVRNRAPGTPA